MKALFLSLAFFLALAPPIHAQDTLFLKKYVSNLKQVEVLIGDQPYSLLFDTGGGETFISPEVAQQLDKPVYGNSTSFRMSGEVVKYQKSDSVTMNIGGNSFFHPTVGVWDLMRILPEGLPKLDGVLSLKSFQDRIITLDLANNILILESPASYQKKLNKLTLLPSRFATGMNGNELTLFLNLPFNNRPYWFLFDSGNLDDLLLSPTTAHEWKLQSDTVMQRKELTPIVVLLGKKQLTSKAAAKPIIYDGALNYGLLSQASFTIDFLKQQVWIK